MTKYESLEWARKNVETNGLKALRELRDMTHDKVRQDFEAAEWFKREHALTDEIAEKGNILAITNRNFAMKGYQYGHQSGYQEGRESGIEAGRAAERAEIREKMESDGVVGDVGMAAVLSVVSGEELIDFEKLSKAAITKILEVI